jgi:hypothetical protein
MRKLNAFGWNVLIRFLLKISLRDINCAFKLFKKEILDRLNLNKVKSKGAMINAELLARLRKLNAKIMEVPVTHFPRRYGKQTGANIKVILKAFQELIILYNELSK